MKHRVVRTDGRRGEQIFHSGLGVAIPPARLVDWLWLRARLEFPTGLGRQRHHGWRYGALWSKHDGRAFDESVAVARSSVVCVVVFVFVACGDVVD